MVKLKVKIKEILLKEIERDVPEGKSLNSVEEEIEDDYYKGKIVLSSDDFVEVKFMSNYTIDDATKSISSMYNSIIDMYRRKLDINLVKSLMNDLSQLIKRLKIYNDEIEGIHASLWYYLDNIDFYYSHDEIDLKKDDIQSKDR
jgi:hypothetical protein